MRRFIRYCAGILVAVVLLMVAATDGVRGQDISKPRWVRCGQVGGATFVEFLPNGSLLVGESGRLKFFEYPSGLLNDLIYIPGHPVFSGDVLSDGSLVYVGGNGTVGVWDCRELKWVKDLADDNGWANLVRISPDERVLAVAWGNVFLGISPKTVLYRLPDGARLGELPGDSATITTLIFTPSSDTLITFDLDGYLRFWNVADQRLLLKRNEISGSIPALSPDGHYFAIEGETGELDTIKVFDVWNNLKRVGSYTSDIAFTGSETTLMYSPDGEYLIVGCNRGVIVYRTADSIIDSWLPVFGSVATMAFSPGDSDLVVSVGPGISEIRIWSKEQWKSGGDTILNVNEAPALNDLYGNCQKVVFSPDSKLVAGEESWSGIINIYESATGKRSGRVFAGPATRSPLTFTPDGSRLVIQSQGKLWMSPVDQWLPHPMDSRDEPGRAYDLTYSPDGRYLAVSNDGFIRFWNGGIDSVVHQYFDSANYNVVFTPDSRFIFFSTLEGIIKMQNVETGEIVLALPGRYDQPWLSLSPDGTLLAWGDFVGNLGVWDLREQRLRWSTVRDGWVLNIAFSTSGSYLYVGDQFNDLLVFDARSGDSVYTYAGYPSAVYGLAASPDGRFVTTAVNDGMLVYNVKSEWSDVPWQSNPQDDRAAEVSSRIVAEYGTGRVHLQSECAPGRIEARVFDLHGEYVAQLEGKCSEGGGIDLRLVGLPPGYYLLRLTDSDGKHHAASVIVPG